MSLSCATCGDALVAERRAAVQERSGPITASVEARAVLRCDHGCAQEEVAPALATALGDAPPAATGRPGAGRCGPCGAPLDLPMRATLRSVTVAPELGPPFTVTFGLPVVRCGECGVDNLPIGLEDDLHRSAHAACGVPLRTVGRGPLSWLRGRGGRGSRARP